MNLAKLSPERQVAAVLATCRPGETPALPPFLRVDAAEAKRRHDWWEAHPPQNVKFGSSMGRLDADQRPEAKEFLRREAERRAAQGQAPNPRKQQVKAAPQDMTGFRWDPRRARFIPDGYEPKGKLTAPPSEEELKLAAALRERNTKKPKKAKRAAPVVGDGRREGESKVDCLVRLLKRPQGMTLEEGAEASGYFSHSVQARIGSDIRKGMGLTVDVEVVEGRGRVFRIREP